MNESIYILVIADTHVHTFNALPDRLKSLAGEVDCVVHCGDFTEMRVVRELEQISKQFIGVKGNSDSPEIKNVLPQEAFFEMGNHKFAVVHPHFGGPPWGLEKELAEKYPLTDIILFGHTHDVLNRRYNGKLLVNPGQGSPIFIYKATVGIIKLCDGKVEARVSEIDTATLF